MPISTVEMLKYVYQCYVVLSMLSGFELYSRWVPLNLANKFVNLHCLLRVDGLLYY